ncbi:hypothetical protein PybrP1_002740, partial [[Pythium] brassicae (nom. inval.)]
MPRERTSRYLSEGDRRDIIRRIEAGEKQVALSKEYQVSRAAICNLYKNRREVLTRVDRDPDAKHPKKQRPAGASASGTASVSRRLLLPCLPLHLLLRLQTRFQTPHPTTKVAKPFAVHDASACSLPIKQLLHSLRGAREVESAAAAGAATTLPLTRPLDERDVCAVSIESGWGQGGAVLLRAFANVQPLSPTGVITLSLLHVAPSSIHFVTVSGALPGLRRVHQYFPEVSLVTAQVDEVMDEQGPPALSVKDAATPVGFLPSGPLVSLATLSVASVGALLLVLVAASSSRSSASPDATGDASISIDIMG